ncbi:MAG: tandem-95 repeat protein [Nitrosomonas sp.]|nr:MAG: tandem-95 repeat protein [Nitrosomonas sp.]
MAVYNIIWSWSHGGTYRTSAYYGTDRTKAESYNDPDWDWSIYPTIDGEELIGHNGDDYISFSESYSRSYDHIIARGGEGRDSIYGGPGLDTLYGQEGFDQVFGNDGNDILSGGNGFDRVSGGKGDDRVNGDAGDDDVHGDAGDDVVAGGDGDDTVYGDAGIDIVDGGNGNDRMYGGSEDDRLYGGSGLDRLYGEAGDDFLSGEDGNDDLVGGGGNNTLLGGNGMDVAFYGNFYGYEISHKDHDGHSLPEGRVRIINKLTGSEDHLVDVEWASFDGSKVWLGEVRPVLVLDFNHTIPRNFYITRDSATNEEYYAYGDGTEPLGGFTVTQKAEILSGVQDIFDRSHIKMYVTDTAPRSGEFTTVFFAPALPAYDDDGKSSTPPVRLLGIAYEDIDQFNNHGDNSVAVFMDGLDTVSQIVETVAHEVGHSYGAIHVDPIKGESSEVMDYKPSSAPFFVNKVTNRIEPPVDDTMTVKPVTHNPVYHIRRYVVGESDSDLRAEGILPGTWDTGAFTLLGHTFSFGMLTMPISNLGIVLYEDPAFVEGDVNDSSGTVNILAATVKEGDVVNFSVPEGTRFKIVASTLDKTIIDVGIRFDGETDPFVVEAGKQKDFSGTVLLRESPDAEPIAIGSITASITDETIIDSGTESLNSPPVAQDDEFNTDKDTVLTENVLSNDSDPDGDTLSVIPQVLTTATGASVALLANGDFSYTPLLNFTGTDSFDYTLLDGKGESSVATVNITINSANNPPTGASSAILSDGTEDTHYIINATALLTGWTDVDGDTLSITSMTADHGSVTNNLDGTYTIVPEANYNGVMTLSYGVSDGADTTATTLGFVLAPVSDTPRPGDDYGAVNEDSSVTVSFDDLMTNDIDVDGASKTIIGIDTTGTAGSVVIDTVNRTMTYSADADAFDLLATGAIAKDSFKYTLQGSSGETNTATVFMDVIGVNDETEISGTIRSETLSGTAGDDRIRGNDGNDILKGGDGDDWLAGERGSDTLFGGLGKDVFFFSKGGGGDTISDFANGIDKIQIAADTGITDFSQLKIGGSAGGKGFVYTTFSLGHDGQVVLNGIPTSALDAIDFIFSV